MKANSYLVSLMLFCGVAYGQKTSVEFATQQSMDGKSFVFCETGVDCRQRTLKVLDVDEDVKRESNNLAAIDKEKVESEIDKEVAKGITIYFDLGSSVLKEAELQKIRMSEGLIASSKMILVKGHTDRVGSIRFNKRLAKVRANRVRDALMRMKVNKEQLKVSSECCIDNPPPINPDARKVTVDFVQ